MALTKQTPVQLNYKLDGDPNKPALLFLNSLGTNLHMWDAQVQALENDFFMIRMDTRGHGLSTVPDGAYTLEQLGQDAIALLNELNIPHAAVCGISMGGITALWLGIHASDRFTKVIAANTALKIGQQAAWNERAELVLQQGKAAMQQLAQTATQRWFTEEFAATHIELVTNVCDMLCNTSPQGYAACCQALALADLRLIATKLTVPVCVIGGQYDPVTTPEDAMKISRAAPRSWLEILQASHLSNIEKPEDFTQVLRDFLIH